MSVSRRVDAVLYALVAVAFVAGCVLTLGARWGERVYPTRTVTVTRVGHVGNGSSAAQVLAAFDGQPRQSSTADQNCPSGTLREWTDGSSWFAIVCSR